MAVNRAGLAATLRGFTRIGLDSPLLIYHLEDIRPYSELTEEAFTAIAGGSLTAVLSTVSVTELLVKPFAQGQVSRVALFERFILSLPNTILVAPSYLIAKEAARLRGRYGIRTPDALLVATALEQRAEALLTNDEGLRRVSAEGIAVLVLEDFV